MTVFNFGSINIDHVYQVERFVRPGETLASQAYRRVLGGKGANQSIALARAGASVRHVGAIGQDDHWITQELAALGVDISAIRTVTGVSGHAIIQVDRQGENCILLHPGANVELTSADLDKQLAETGTDDWLLLQNETSAVAAAIELAHSRGLRIAFNPAPMTPAVRKLPLEQLDLLIVNQLEARQISGEADSDMALRKLGAQFPDTAFVITLGPRGALYLQGDERHRVPGHKVRAVDTTAAGDTFTGYLLAQLAAGEDVLPALQLACCAAALCVTRPGAAPSIPSRDEVLAWQAGG